MSKPVITIPHNFTPRSYQVPLYNALVPTAEGGLGKKRGVVVWHRRAGKDKTFVSIMAREACKRVGSYFYILPYYKQARKIIWEGMDKTGFPMLDHFPKQLITKRNNQEMILELANGSIVSFLGSDNIDSIVGTNPVGVIFSEFSLHKVAAWNYLRPILLENEGWALFNGTPRGKNHLYQLYMAALDNPEWFVDLRTIDDTKVLTHEQVEEEVENGMPRALAKQEFFCSWDAALTGAYYGEAMDRMHMQGRICNIPYEPSLPTHFLWDLGIEDMMTIIAFQQVGKEIRFIDSIADNGHGLDHYVKELQNRGYIFGDMYLPHDIKVRELSDGKTRYGKLKALVPKTCNLIVVKKRSLEDGIEATRSFLSKVWIDKKQQKLIEALKSYRADWDAESQTYGKPVHDWSSHWADAVRQGAVGIKDKQQHHDLPAYAEGTGYDPLRHFNNIQQPRAAAQQRAWNPRDYAWASDASGGWGYNTSS